MEPVELLLIQSSVSVNFSTAASLQHFGVLDEFLCSAIIARLLSKVCIFNIWSVGFAQELLDLIFYQRSPQLIIIEIRTTDS